MMSHAVLIDYGCHSFSYRLASRLSSHGFPIRYLANGSLESPNLTSLAAWEQNEPHLVRSVRCTKPYGKVSLRKRLSGEIEWAGHCTRALKQESPSVVIGSCIPLAALTRIQNWCQRKNVPFIYWLQDLQGRAIHSLLGGKLGFAGHVLGSFAHIWEQHMIERSRLIITIARGHERELPYTVRRDKRFALLENWANIEDIPLCSTTNDWAHRQGLDKTLNVVYSGTLGLKHDLSTFLALAHAFRSRHDVRVVVVSSGQAADRLRTEALSQKLNNLIVLPFQEYRDLPQVLGAASILIAPLDGSAGAFCVPSKILAYLCAGRPTVIAIDRENPAAATIEQAHAGYVVKPGSSHDFVAAVEHLLNDHELRSLLGNCARRYAESAFVLDSIVPRFVNILRNSGIAMEPPALMPLASATAHV